MEGGEPTLVITRGEETSFVVGSSADKLMELAELATPDDPSALTVHHMEAGIKDIDFFFQEIFFYLKKVFRV